MAFGFNFSFGKLPNSIERDSSGNFFYSWLENYTSEKTFGSEAKKLETILTNPAAMKVLKFNADTGALGKINKLNGKSEELDWLYTYAKKPNDWQTWTDFIWDYYFWIQFGRACLYKQNNVMYFLIPSNIELNTVQEDLFKQITFSSKGKREALNGTFKYKEANGKTIKLELKNLYIINEMGSINGNWFKGASSFDSLYKVCVNSQLALSAKGSNLKFTDKFLVSGQTDQNNVSQLPMANEEKFSIEKAFKGVRQIFATKSKVDVKQMVSNLDALKLDDHYLRDLHIIGNMFGIPKDVLEALGIGSTYENQEKSLGRHVDYNLLPKGQKLTDLLEVILEQDYLRFSFKHLSFNQVFETEKQNARKLELDNLTIAQQLGLNEKTVQNELNRIYEQN